MQNKKVLIKNTIIFLLLIILTFAFVFKKHNFPKAINIILNVKSSYIVIAIICMLLYITFESINIKNILISLGTKTNLLKTIKYTFIGFFFSGITPGGSGGQPMQVYYMKKANISVTNSTIALLIQICSFHIVTIICGIIGLIMNYHLMTKDFTLIFIIGMILKIIVLATFLIGLFSKKMSKTIISIFLKILTILKYHNLDTLKIKINESLAEYHEGAIYIKQHRKIFLSSLIIVFFQSLMYYSVTYFIYRAFDLNAYSYLRIITIQALLLVSTSSIPLPGSVGISENAFLTINLAIFQNKYLPSAMLLSRGISFYLLMIISLIVVIINSLNDSKEVKE